MDAVIDFIRHFVPPKPAGAAAPGGKGGKGSGRGGKGRRGVGAGAAAAEVDDGIDLDLALDDADAGGDEGFYSRIIREMAARGVGREGASGAGNADAAAPGGARESEVNIDASHIRSFGSEGRKLCVREGVGRRRAGVGVWGCGAVR